MKPVAQVVALEPEGPDGHGVNWLAGKRPKPGDLLYGGDAVAYCMQRYRSYDPRSGTYLNYDGNRYPCP